MRRYAFVHVAVLLNACMAWYMGRQGAASSRQQIAPDLRF